LIYVNDIINSPVGTNIDLLGSWAQSEKWALSDPPDQAQNIKKSIIYPGPLRPLGPKSVATGLSWRSKY
jgi:hypothetical protein